MTALVVLTQAAQGSDSLARQLSGAGLEVARAADAANANVRSQPQRDKRDRSPHAWRNRYNDMNIMPEKETELCPDGKDCRALRAWAA